LKGSAPHQSRWFFKVQRPAVLAAGEFGRWAGREKVALISFGYQNIFATSVSFDSGKQSTLSVSRNNI